MILAMQSAGALGGQGGAGPLAGQPGLENACQFFVKAGWCKFGDACRYAHVGAARDQEVCQFFVRAGWCRWGDSCRHMHPGGSPAGGQMAGGAPHALPRQPGGLIGRMPGSAEACQFFMKAGWCKYGDDCRYQHAAGGPAGGAGVPIAASFASPAAHLQPPSSQPRAGQPLGILAEFRGQPAVCKYFSVPGGCRLGDSCKFLHTGAPGQLEVCNFFAREGWCKFGDQCKYIHAAAAQAPETDPPPCDAAGGWALHGQSGLGIGGGGSIDSTSDSAAMVGRVVPPPAGGTCFSTASTATSGVAAPLGLIGVDSAVGGDSALAEAFAGLQAAISKVAPPGP